MKLFDFFLTDDSEENEDFRASTYLSPSYVFRVKFRFGRKLQESFLKHFLSIRGGDTNNGSAKKTLIILEKMKAVYELNLSSNKTSWAVATLIHSRLIEGYSVSQSMGDIFDISFVSIIQSMESSSAINVSIAINRATKDAITLKNSIFKAKLFISIITVALIGAIYISKFAKSFYDEKLLEDPEKLKFVEYPEHIFNAMAFLAEHMFIVVSIFGCMYFLNKYILKNVMDNRRDFLDKFYPPAILNRYISSVKIYSSLALLVSIIEKKTLDALDLMLESCTPYEAKHINIMMDRLIAGEEGAHQLDTGLLTKELSLSLNMANKGDRATIKTALVLLDQEGKEKLLSMVKRTSMLILIGGLAIAASVALISLSVFVQTLMTMTY